jgi:hypothetical protein
VRAILNYSYAILETEATIACHVMGLDPSVGLMHTDLRYRGSLSTDRSSQRGLLSTPPCSTHSTRANSRATIYTRHARAYAASVQTSRASSRVLHWSTGSQSRHTRSSSLER